MSSSGLIDQPDPEWRSAAAFAAVLGGVLVAGLWSLGRIPFYRPFLGLDFQNIYAFHNCPLVKDLGVYAPSGSACGDVSGRAFRYPPLIYHLFTWVRLFGFTDAARLWIGFTAASMVIVGGVWARLDHQVRRSWRTIVLAALWLLLLAQFPSVFQLERGNNDVIPILIWTAAAFAFSRRWYAAAGALGAIGALGKIYPTVALAIVAVGVLRMRWRAIVTFASGGVAGIIISALFWPREMITYWTEVLPSFASGANDVVAYSHPLRGLAVPAGVKIILGVALMGSWALAAWYKTEKEPLLVFAGALAISTYFAGVSYDYNLITVYPLLLLVAARALNGRNPTWWRVAAIGSVVAIASGQGVFTPPGHLLAQIAALVGIASLTIGGPDAVPTREVAGGVGLSETRSRTSAGSA